MRLTLHTYKLPLDKALCDALSQSLKLDTNLTEGRTRIVGRSHYIHTWEVFVVNVKDVERAMAKFDKKHDTGFVLEPLDTKMENQWSMKVWGAIMAFLRIVHLSRFMGG